MKKFDINGVLLYTDQGVRLITTEGFQHMNSDDYFNQCNCCRDDFNNKLKANGLIVKSILLDRWTFTGHDWYKNRDNFENYNAHIQRT